MVSGRHYLGLVCHRDTIAAAADLHIPPCTQSYRTSGYICTGEDTGVDTGRSRSGHRLGVGVTPKLGAPPQAVGGPPRKSHLRPTLELWGTTKFAGEGRQILCELYDTIGLVLRPLGSLLVLPLLPLLQKHVTLSGKQMIWAIASTEQFLRSLIILAGFFGWFMAANY